MKREEESVLPQGWHERFNGKADFSSSYRELARCGHFYSEAMRGRIRSYELRCEEAAEHFLKAGELSSKEPETVPNLVRQFLLNVYTFDNALADAPLERGVRLPTLWLPELPDRLTKDYPEVRLIKSSRKQTEAVLRLHVGEPEQAASLYEELLWEDKAALSIGKAFWYLGLAAALHSLDLMCEMRENLENAGLILRTTGNTLNRAYASALLHAFHCYLEEKEDAVEWRAFLERLPCPEPTKEVFKERAKLVLARCQAQQCLLVV